MLSPYRIPPDSHKRRQKILNQEQDLEGTQMFSNDCKRPQMTTNDPEVKPVKSKNKLEGGAIIEINGEYLDEILHNDNL